MKGFQVRRFPNWVSSPVSKRHFGTPKLNHESLEMDPQVASSSRARYPQFWRDIKRSNTWTCEPSLELPHKDPKPCNYRLSAKSAPQLAWVLLPLSETRAGSSIHDHQVSKTGQTYKAIARNIRELRLMLFATFADTKCGQFLRFRTLGALVLCGRASTKCPIRFL